MKLKIAVLAGDGIGPEVTREAQNILTAVAEAGGHEFIFTDALIGGVAITANGTPLPQSTIDTCLDSDAVLLGAVGDNKFNALSPDKRPEAGLLQIRQVLGGFANLRPSVAYPALSENSPLRPEVTKGVDILFVRELLGGLYFGAAALVEQGERRSHQHHALHQVRSRARRPRRLRARAEASQEAHLRRQGQCA